MKATKQLKERVKFDAKDDTIYLNKAQQFVIKEYPTIKSFPKEKYSKEALDYSGGRSSQNIVLWILIKLKNSNLQKD